MNKEKINILVTLDENYIPQLNVMLCSLIHSNPANEFDVYLMHNSIRKKTLARTKKILGGRGRLIPIDASTINTDNAPTTSRYPKEIYYRIFAAQYLPGDMERILYLDPDIIVNGDINEMYNTPMRDCFFAAASHVSGLLKKVNDFRLNSGESNPYINSGVLLMNLKQLRAEQQYDEVFEFIEQHKKTLILPDQDIISGLYGNKIISLDPDYYNMTERLYIQHLFDSENFSLDWVRSNSVIIHYCGRNKPWKTGYIGQLDVFYKETVRTLTDKPKKKQQLISLGFR